MENGYVKSTQLTTQPFQISVKFYALVDHIEDSENAPYAL
jgi:hypothetical protein